MKNLKNVPVATARPLGTNLLTKRLEGYAKNLGIKVKIEATANGLRVVDAGEFTGLVGWILGSDRAEAVCHLDLLAGLVKGESKAA